MRFIEELKRRKVVRVAAVYAASAFVVLQASDLVLPRLGVPDWAMSVVVVLALLGFPLALVLAWVLELTPGGVRVTTSHAPDTATPPPSLLGRRTVIATALLVTLGVGLGAGLFLAPGATVAEGASSASAADAKSVAVLPFADLSQGADQQWFAEGVAEEILTSLARLPELRVIGRNSSFLFADGTLDDRVIADTLGVAHLVKGSVRRVGERLRVSAQLIRAVDGEQLWSESYDRAAADLLDVQRDVAEKVVAALDIVLDDERRTRMFASGTRSTAAFEAYLRGRQLFQQAHGGPATLAQANVWFDSALALDPRFGRAALLRADRYMHQALDGRGQISDLPGMSTEGALTELRRSLALAVQHAPDDYSRLMMEVERELFAPSWHRLPGLARQLAQLGGLEDQDVEIVWAPNFLAVTGHTDLARAVTARALATERLVPNAWQRMIHIRMVAGDLEGAAELIAQARAHIGETAALHRSAVFTAVLQHDTAAVLAEATGRMAWMAEALRGETEPVLRLAAEWAGQSDWPDPVLLHLYHQAGDTASTRELVRRIDALPSGPAMLVTHLFRCGAALEFDLADAPNFSARLREAGVDPASFRRMPRLSRQAGK